MRWLHRALDNCYKLLAKRGHLNLIVQRRAKCLQRASGIAPAPVKSALDPELYTPAQRLEQRRRGRAAEAAKLRLIAYPT
jgi:hypothetical protein